MKVIFAPALALLAAFAFSPCQAWGSVGANADSSDHASADGGELSSEQLAAQKEYYAQVKEVLQVLRHETQFIQRSEAESGAEATQRNFENREAQHEFFDDVREELSEVHQTDHDLNVSLKRMSFLTAY